MKKISLIFCSIFATLFLWLCILATVFVCKTTAQPKFEVVYQINTFIVLDDENGVVSEPISHSITSNFEIYLNNLEEISEEQFNSHKINLNKIGCNVRLSNESITDNINIFNSEAFCLQNFNISKSKNDAITNLKNGDTVVFTNAADSSDTKFYKATIKKIEFIYVYVQVLNDNLLKVKINNNYMHFLTEYATISPFID